MNHRFVDDFQILNSGCIDPEWWRKLEHAFFYYKFDENGQMRLSVPVSAELKVWRRGRWTASLQQLFRAIFSKPFAIDLTHSKMNWLLGRVSSPKHNSWAERLYPCATNNGGGWPCRKFICRNRMLNLEVRHHSTQLRISENALSDFHCSMLCHLTTFHQIPLFPRKMWW